MRRPSIYNLFLTLGIFLLLSGCENFLQKEPLPQRPPTQIRVVNLSNQKVEVFINEEKVATVDSFAKSNYILQEPREPRQIDLVLEDGTRVPLDQPLRGLPTANPDTAIFKFDIEGTYGFYVLPASARTTDSSGNTSAFKNKIAYQIINEEAFEVVPGRAKVRFLNFTNIRGGQYVASNSNSIIPIPRLYRCNPRVFNPITGISSLNEACELKLISRNISLNVRTYSEFALMNATKQQFYLVLGNRGNTATYIYDLELENLEAYSLVLTGDIDLGSPQRNFGVTLRAFKEGTDEPALELKPSSGSEAAVRYIGAAFIVNDGDVLADLSPLIKSSINPNQSSYEYTGFLRAGKYNIRITPTNTPSPVFYETDYEFEAATSYTIYGGPSVSNRIVDGWIVKEEQPIPANGKIKIRLINLAFNGVPLDLRINAETGPVLASNVGYKTKSDYFELEAVDPQSNTSRSYTFFLTETGSGKNIFPSLDGQEPIGFRQEINAGQVYTVLLQGSYTDDYLVPLSFSMYSDL